MKRRTFRRFALGAAAIILIGGCQAGQSADKTGGDTVVLKIVGAGSSNDNGQTYAPQAFMDALEALSGGQFKVEFTDQYGDGAANADASILKALAAGDFDGGWPAVRSFGDAGIPAVNVLEAPMTITSYAAEKDLVTSPVADHVLAHLDGSGVVGLGLAVGPLRRSFAADAPLLSPQDWHGARFAIFDSPVQEATVRALGGDPEVVGTSWADEVAAGTLRGREFDIAQYADNDGGPAVGNVAENVILWPKFLVLAFSAKRLNSLSSQQQEWVRKAADRAVQASVDATYDESTPARQLCSKGVRFRTASPEQVTDLRTAVRPVIDRLAADPTTGQLLAEVQGIAAAHPDPQVLDVPGSCRQGVAEPVVDDVPPSESSALPDGIYRVELTAGDIAAAGINDADGPAGTWTLTVNGGTYEVTCRPVGDTGKDCGNMTTGKPLEVGDLRGTGQRVFFVPDAQRLSAMTGCLLPTSTVLSDHCGPEIPYSLTWNVDGQNLLFSDEGGPLAGISVTVKPWQKIG